MGKNKKIDKKKVKKIAISILIPIIVIMVIVLFPEKSRFKIIDDYSRIFSQIATILGVGGVFYALKSFKKSEEESKQKEYSELMKNSIKVLDIFSSKLIPMMVDFEKDTKKKYSGIEKIFLDKAKSENFDVEELPDELKNKLLELAKTESNIYKVFNSIEQVCAYISYNLIIEDVVYPTTHKVLLDFLNSNDELLNKMTSNDAPYTNLHKVKKEWSKVAKKESLNLKQLELDKEKEQANL